MTFPKELQARLKQAFAPIKVSAWKGTLIAEGEALYQAVYDRWLVKRTHEDNRPEHELVVLSHFIRIATESGAEGPIQRRPFHLTDIRVGMSACLLHDTCFIARITEQDILRAATETEASQLRAARENQRRNHMRGSAQNAKELLPQLSNPANPKQPLLNDTEILRTLAIIALHDTWKLGFAWPPSTDWLAVCFVEADALWPLSPTGPLADLQRRHGTNYLPKTDEPLRIQARENLRTQLEAYRSSFVCAGARFQDDTTLIRTRAGARILRRYRRLWGLD